jgi:hypothetical protein
VNDWTMLGTRAFRMWLDTMNAGAAAWTTIATRLPILAEKGLTSPEASRMIQEKVAAATEGAAKASLAGMALAGRAIGGVGPIAAASGALRVADALARPARRKVKANAKRLTRRRKPHLKKR